MNIMQNNESNHKTNDRLWQKKSGIQLLILLAVSFCVGTIPARAQVTVELPQIVLEAKHTEYVSTQNPNNPEIINVKSSNPSVATAEAYRVNRVQIVAVAPGKTTIEFFDNAERKLYKALVWVTGPNRTGGGGPGYNPQLTQLPQIVMPIRHTENAHTPDDRAAKISGVKSSNPSVATARTDPPRGIQIYAVALGDTWIDFTNDTTGITYQVHVWVRDSGDIPPAPPGPNPNPTPRPKPGPQPKPNPNPIPAPSPGHLDKCLLGRWVSESADFNGKTSGGAGAIAVIEANGNISVDYNGMNKIVFSGGDSYLWTGTASGHISAENGGLVADRVDRSNFNFDYFDMNGKSMFSNGWPGWNKTLGGIFPPSRPGMGISYTCSETELTIQSFGTFIFKREK
jgi:hypothetical protein